MFHATAIYATGGMVLSGDDLTTIPEGRLAMLKKLLPPSGQCRDFDDDNARVGSSPSEAQMVCCSTGPTVRAR